MNRAITTLLLFCAISFFAPRPASAVVIPTVPVGNAGNAGEVQSQGQVQYQGTFGAVAYYYRIGTTEVSNAQYVAFLNAKAASDPLGLYNTSMGGGFGGITQSGSSGSYTYAAIAGRGNKPVNYVSWYDSIRFANWLNNGQGSGDTETGAYTLNGGTVPSNGLSITRNAGATWFLTSEDEWYKAAYQKNDGVTGNYFINPTASDSTPIPEAPAGGSNSANYNFVVGDLTDVGAYTASASPYGTFDQGGNLWEWNESVISTLISSRGQRGGTLNSNSQALRSNQASQKIAADESAGTGFRVATTVPEPSTLLLGVLGVIGLLLWRRVRR